MKPKDLARRWFETLWNDHNPAVLDELMHPDALGTSETGPIRGPKEFREQVYDVIIAAFPDIRIQIDGTVAEGDEVVVRWAFVATHTGPLGDLPASGRQVRVQGMTWMLFQHGKIIEGADAFNMHAMLSYLSTGTESATVRNAAHLA